MLHKQDGPGSIQVVLIATSDRSWSIRIAQQGFVVLKGVIALCLLTLLLTLVLLLVV